MKNSIMEDKVRAWEPKVLQGVTAVSGNPERELSEYALVCHSLKHWTKRFRLLKEITKEAAGYCKELQKERLVLQERFIAAQRIPEGVGAIEHYTQKYSKELKDQEHKLTSDEIIQRLEHLKALKEAQQKWEG